MDDLKDHVRRVALALLDMQTATDEVTARRVRTDPNDVDLTATATATLGLQDALGSGFSLDEPNTDEGRATASVLFAAVTLISQLLSRTAKAEGSSREVVTAELREWLYRNL
ncbi:hypothetical protein [Microbacterium sp. SLBN-111]|uniref:hypothetical protein n=1 Tax=Microbacterium sp. SLBN-111 TaxID=3377733 RepID=UPI003C745B86